MGGIVTRVCSLYPCTETHRGESTDQLYLHWEMFLKPREWASFACKISIDSITLKLFFITRQQYIKPNVRYRSCSDLSPVAH